MRKVEVRSPIHNLRKNKNLQNSENDFIPNVRQCKNKYMQYPIIRNGLIRNTSEI